MNDLSQLPFGFTSRHTIPLCELRDWTAVSFLRQNRNWFSSCILESSQTLIHAYLCSKYTVNARTELIPCSLLSLLNYFDIFKQTHLPPHCSSYVTLFCFLRWFTVICFCFAFLFFSGIGCYTPKYASFWFNRWVNNSVNNCCVRIIAHQICCGQIQAYSQQTNLHRRRT